MYKYMKLRPEKKVAEAKGGLEDANTGDDDFESEGDPDLDKFVDEEMDREMKRMAMGAPGGMPDSDEEDPSLSEQGSSEDDADQEEASDGFFSGEEDL